MKNIKDFLQILILLTMLITILGFVLDINVIKISCRGATRACYYEYGSIPNNDDGYTIGWKKFAIVPDKAK